MAHPGRKIAILWNLKAGDWSGYMCARRWPMVSGVWASPFETFKVSDGMATKHRNDRPIDLRRYFFSIFCQLRSTVREGALPPSGMMGVRNRCPSLLTS